ncbi:hypothetical protein G6F50_014145 [Rhizopus delemar]|uniref:Uncharacterized protein n=1 Tax=Rhizopus delemar TaxID=936053 RepID=A0A9P7C9K3_9FUNG|nr:hypothetical protein G6F50_014145 [Rhizopus delemar]
MRRQARQGSALARNPPMAGRQQRQRIIRPRRCGRTSRKAHCHRTPPCRHPPRLPGSTRMAAPPQPDGIPRASRESRLRHRLQRHHGELHGRLAVHQHPQRAHGVLGRNRRHQRLLRRPHRLHLGARGHGHIGVPRKPGLQAVAFALPDFRRGHGLAARIQLDGIESLKPPLQQLAAFLGAQFVGRRADHHRDQAALVGAVGPARRRHDAVAGGFRMARLQAVHARVQPQQPVAVRLGDLSRMKRVARMDRSLAVE